MYRRQPPLFVRSNTHYCMRSVNLEKVRGLYFSDFTCTASPNAKIMEVSDVGLMIDRLMIDRAFEAGLTIDIGGIDH